MQVVEKVKTTPGVRGVLSYLTAEDPVYLGKTGSFLIAGLDPKGQPLERLIPRLRLQSESLLADLRNRYPTAELGWTGEIPLNYDLRKVSTADARTAEVKVLPITLLLLVFAFGGLTAALLPVTVGVLAIVLTLGTSALLARHWQISILVQNMASMLGLGLGVDYALLIVSRFRESLAEGLTIPSATDQSLRRVGHTLTLAAVPVGIGFAALLTVPINEVLSVGIAGILVTAFSLALSLTLLPACLMWLGRRIDAARFSALSRARESRSRRALELWRRFGKRVTARPALTLSLAGGGLLLLAGQALRLDPAFPRGDWLPPHSESVRALHHLAQNGQSNVIQTLRILVDLPAQAPLSTKDGWGAVSNISRRLETDALIEHVYSLPSMTGRNPTLMRFVPDFVRASFVTADGGAALIEAIPRAQLSPNELTDLVRRLRDADPRDLTGLSGTRIRIGGLPAFNADYQNAIVGRFRSVLSLVILATLSALFVGFRSVLVAVKAVALNLLSVGASFGALVLVFQEGHGVNLLGLDGPTGAVFPIVPVLVFCIVFGLSMDYEVIMVARVAEARLSGMEESTAITEGLARTGPVITSAAAIMVMVFGAFTLGEFLVIKMLGFTLSVAVFLDATLVRLVIGPALLQLAGRWNWWPGDRRRAKA